MFRTKQRSEDTLYWDGGAKKIMAWKKQHLLALPSDVARAADGLCKENWVCNILELGTLEMEDLNEVDPDSDSDLPSSTTAEKSKICYVLNEY